MQELLTPQHVTGLDEGFDGYQVEYWSFWTDSTARVSAVMKKIDTNMKSWWIVADRVVANDQWRTEQVLEFRHASQRAHHEYTRRIT